MESYVNLLVPAVIVIILIAVVRSAHPKPRSRPRSPYGPAARPHGYYPRQEFMRRQEEDDY